MRNSTIKIVLHRTRRQQMVAHGEIVSGPHMKKDILFKLLFFRF